MNTYTAQFIVPCLNNGIRVTYTLRVETTEVVMVEDIAEVLCELERREPSAYHEQMADELAQRFGGQQTLRATHHGVEIVTERIGK